MAALEPTPARTRCRDVRFVLETRKSVVSSGRFGRIVSLQRLEHVSRGFPEHCGSSKARRQSPPVLKNLTFKSLKSQRPRRAGAALEPTPPARVTRPASELEKSDGTLDTTLSMPSENAPALAYGCFLFFSSIQEERHSGLRTLQRRARRVAATTRSMVVQIRLKKHATRGFARAHAPALHEGLRVARGEALSDVRRGAGARAALGA